MKKFLLIFFLLIGSVSIKAQTVYITKTGEKYHEKSCHHLSKFSISISLEDAKDRGYTPCKVCKPTTTVQRSSTSNTSTTNSYQLNSRATQKTSVAVQCSATTQKGTRCKRMTTNDNGRCWQH